MSTFEFIEPSTVVVTVVVLFALLLIMILRKNGNRNFGTFEKFMLVLLVVINIFQPIYLHC